jgi:hypothetical protein
MPAFDIINTRGVNIATINVGTTLTAGLPPGLEIPGDGIAPYPPIIGNDLYRMLENFADTTEPTPAVEGQFWYKVGNVPHFYDGAKFIPLLSGINSHAFGFEMLPTAVDMDFTVATTYDLFTAPGDGSVWHPTALLLIPQAVVDVTTAALFNVQILAAEDVLETSQVSNPDPDAHAFYSIEGTTRFASNVDTISLEITNPATGGGTLDLRFDGFLFGYLRV